jgi:nucleotide-binding universal stress UspA family protein
MTHLPRRVLVATDFSPGSDEALTQAVEMARQTAASVDLLYVLEAGAAEFPYGLTYYADLGGLIAYIDRELATRADRVTAAGVSCQTRMVEGSAAKEIVLRAREIGADLIVIGTHGRTGIAHALLGSVAERVVQHARCPVLAVPFASKAA